jgi:hypothetical protein
MRFKLILGSGLALLIGSTFYTILLLTGEAATSRVSASASATQAVPTLTSQQLAVIQAINTLLLADDESAETLVLLYVNGDNDLAAEMQKYQLVQNIHRGAANPAIVVRMVLDWPGTGNSRYYQVDQLGATQCDFLNDFTCGGRYRIGQNVRAFPEDLGDPANLSQFIQDAIAEQPEAQRIILALIGHGGGWSPNLLAGQPWGHAGKPGNGDRELGGLLWDNSTESGIGNSLSTLDLRQALNDAKTKTGRMIDLLYLDACLMGMWEVAHEVRNEVNYLLASQSWSWTSFAYDAHLGTVKSMLSIEQIGAQWISNEEAILKPINHAYTYSLLDLTQLPTVTASIDTLAQQLYPLTQTTEDKSRIRTAFESSDCFDSNADALINRTDPTTGNGVDNYCDLASFVAQLQTQFSTNTQLVSTAQAVQSAISRTVRSQAYASGIPGRHSSIPWQWHELGGLSIYTPLGQDDWKRGLYIQLQVANDTHWDEFITQYWDAPVPAAPACPPKDCSLPAGPLPIISPIYLPMVQR